MKLGLTATIWIARGLVDAEPEISPGQKVKIKSQGQGAASSAPTGLKHDQKGEF
jgi:hypothetical protein